MYYRTGEPLPNGFPFCGERCKMLDLGKWLDEEYVLGSDLTDEDVAGDKEREAEPGMLLTRSRENEGTSWNDDDDEGAHH